VFFRSFEVTKGQYRKQWKCLLQRVVTRQLNPSFGGFYAQRIFHSKSSRDRSACVFGARTDRVMVLSSCWWKSHKYYSYWLGKIKLCLTAADMNGRGRTTQRRSVKTAQWGALDSRLSMMLIHYRTRRRQIAMLHGDRRRWRKHGQASESKECLRVVLYYSWLLVDSEDDELCGEWPGFSETAFIGVAMDVLPSRRRHADDE